VPEQSVSGPYRLKVMFPVGWLVVVTVALSVAVSLRTVPTEPAAVGVVFRDVLQLGGRFAEPL